MSLVYNSYTIETNTPLTYDPPKLNKWGLFALDWNRFWQSSAGEDLAFALYVAATMLAYYCPAFMPIYLMALGGSYFSLAVGGVIAGFQNRNNGRGFWENVGTYIEDNWAQTIAIDMALAMVAFGISQAAVAIRSARSSPEFKAWLDKGPADNVVYYGIDRDTGKEVYTGITKQKISTRLYQHNRAGKNFKDLRIIRKHLTRNQARAIETFQILNGPANKLNKILSISRKNKFFTEAMRWASWHIWNP